MARAQQAAGHRAQDAPQPQRQRYACTRDSQNGARGAPLAHALQVECTHGCGLRELRNAQARRAGACASGRAKPKAPRRRLALPAREIHLPHLSHCECLKAASALAANALQEPQSATANACAHATVTPAARLSWPCQPRGRRDQPHALVAPSDGQSKHRSPPQKISKP